MPVNASAAGSRTNRLLGYPADARLLIVNADDFGMCQAVDEAIVGALQEGIVRSTSLMVPCAGMPDAARFLAEHPEVPFGIHLAVLADSVYNRWRPVTPGAMAPSLVDSAGYFYTFERMREFLAHARLDELETEWRAQIEVVLALGLRPTHLDWHALRIGGRRDIFDIIFCLAREYRLALRVAGRGWIEELQARGFPTNDEDFLDSYGLDPATKSATYARLLHELPPGLSEWAVHPALDTPEFLAIEPGPNRTRQADYDFLVSTGAKEIVQTEGIILLDYRALQVVWQKM